MLGSTAPRRHKPAILFGKARTVSPLIQRIAWWQDAPSPQVITESVTTWSGRQHGRRRCSFAPNLMCRWCSWPGPPLDERRVGQNRTFSFLVFSDEGVASLQIPSPLLPSRRQLKRDKVRVKTLRISPDHPVDYTIINRNCNFRLYFLKPGLKRRPP